MDVPQPPDAHRFRDPRTHLYSLAAAGIIVVCPRCSGPAVVRAQPDGSTPGLHRPRRLACGACAYTDSWRPPAASHWGGPVDPYFRRPLWLQAPCCGGRTLWAFNAEHLDLIDGYVRARLRERGPDHAFTSLLEKLPAWITSAKHRDEVVRTIQRIRGRMP